MKWQWIGLVLFSFTLLPAGLALAAGRVPRRLRARLAPVRPCGWATLLVYSTAPLNAIPRLADASPDVVLVCTAAGSALCIAGSLLMNIVIYRHQNRAVDGPRSAGPPTGVGRADQHSRSDHQQGASASWPSEPPR